MAVDSVSGIGFGPCPFAFAVGAAEVGCVIWRVFCGANSATQKKKPVLVLFGHFLVIELERFENQPAVAATRPRNSTHLWIPDPAARSQLSAALSLAFWN